MENKKIWMRFRASYSLWNKSSEYKFESVEKSLSSFAERLERELEKNEDVIKTISIENLGCE